MNSSPMPHERDATILEGYLPGIDFYPNSIKHQKPLRFAIAFNCYYPSVEGGYFLDRERIAALCDKMIGSFRSEVFDTRKKRIQLDGSEQTIGTLSNIILYENTHPIAWLTICRWDTIGGPKEYHDRYTIEVFTFGQYFEHFLRVARESLTDAKYNMTVIECPQEPENLTGWSRLVRHIQKLLS